MKEEINQTNCVYLYTYTHAHFQVALAPVFSIYSTLFGYITQLTIDDSERAIEVQ